MSNPTAPPSYGEAMDDKTYAGAPYPQPTAYPQPAAYPQPESYAYASQPAENVPFTSGAGYAAAASHPADIRDVEAGFSTRGGFNDKNVRRNFIRRVFIILGLQLAVTFGVVCAFTLIPGANDWVKNNPGLYYASYAVFLVLYLVLVCVESARRRHPHNLIMLAVFTLALSYMTGTIAAFYSTRIVMIALGVTVVVCVAVILFSIQTKFDFTKCSGVLFVLCMVLFLFGFITIFTWHRAWYLQVVYGCLGALVFTLFLAFDTQLVMGGKKHELDPEEYVYGALTLYIDVVYIFLFILSIFGGSE